MSERINLPSSRGLRWSFYSMLLVSHAIKVQYKKRIREELGHFQDLLS